MGPPRAAAVALVVVVVAASLFVVPGTQAAVTETGFDRHDTALTVLKYLLGTTRPHDCFDGGQIGLAIDRKAPDAISSGPLLGERCAPLLLVRTDSVPPAVNEYLASADARLGGDSGLLSITVLGGTAAVSNETVDSFRSRAQQGEPFAATVSATAGASSFVVTFSEDVKEIATEVLAEISPIDCFTGDAVGLATGFGSPDAVASAPLLLTDRLSLPEVSARLLGTAYATSEGSARANLTGHVASQASNSSCGRTRRSLRCRCSHPPVVTPSGCAPESRCKPPT
ncbi:cell wall-binding repeat-containing protein [Candidatus Poriferisodalis sp.]|uniref:cell wall-binding repeat-containing protein n=1 Tax=Candidatus Poriferisodalis sp. TaxID=3101277 RepID=UPI003B020DE1